MKFRITFTFGFVLCLLAGACSTKSETSSGKPGEDPQEQGGQDPSREPAIEPGTVIRYLTSPYSKVLFQKSESKTGAPEGSSSKVVDIYKEDVHQTIDGFGCAMTGSTCYNLSLMTAADRQAVLKEIFDPVEGLGSSLIRVSIGASDFNLKDFTWCDTEGLSNFEINAEDKKHLIPMLREVYKINPKVKIIASPWSAPKWMKLKSSSQTAIKWTGGTLNPEHYDDYAQYFVKWIQAMQKEGFNIYAMTVQNEPLNTGNSMSMYMSWQEQRDFIKKSLGKAFENAGIKTKILAFDHNYNYDNKSGQSKYPLNIYNDPEASKYIAGSAWHDYGGTVSELDDILAKAPMKEIYFTEASIGTWNHGKTNEWFPDCVLNHFESIFMGTMYRESKGVTLWNLLLDSSNGPYRTGGCSTCYGALTMDKSTRKIIRRNSHYYDIAHTSKVIRQGAVRVGAGGYAPANVSYQAFVNPDGTVAVIILNKSGSEVEMVFKGNQEAYTKVPARSIVSLIWDDNK